MSATGKVIRFLETQGLVRPRDLDQIGVSRRILYHLTRMGRVVRVARGLYSLPDSSVTEHRSLIEVARRAPDAVICLLSALAFHQIGTQLPGAVWIAIEQGRHKPRIDFVSIEVVHLPERLLHLGVDKHREGGGVLRVTSPARTVADCFKFRSKIGTDVAVEALKDGWRQGRFEMGELREYATACRVANVMRPYVESLD